MGLAIYVKNGHTSTSSSVGKDQSGSGYVNLNPPTAQDKAANNALKDQLGQDQSPAAAVQNGKKVVTPVITSASADNVSAYVPGVFEDGGTCTMKATLGSQTITKTSTGFENASYTSCPPIDPQLSSGNWVVTVSYSSNTAQGESQTSPVKVN